jgi:hypothetical protein
MHWTVPCWPATHSNPFSPQARTREHHLPRRCLAVAWLMRRGGSPRGPDVPRWSCQSPQKGWLPRVVWCWRGGMRLSLKSRTPTFAQWPSAGDVRDGLEGRDRGRREVMSRKANADHRLVDHGPSISTSREECLIGVGDLGAPVPAGGLGMRRALLACVHPLRASLPRCASQHTGMPSLVSS